MTAIRYRDQVERELHDARRKRDANLRAADATIKKDTAALCDRLAESLDAKVARLEAELPTAPVRAREAGSFRRASALTPLEMGYRTTPYSEDELAAAAACPLDIPAYLRRSPS